MKIEAVKCDKCGSICRNDYMTVYRNTKTYGRLGHSDICESCYNIMLKALDEALDMLDIHPNPVTDYDKLCEEILKPSSGVDAFEKSIKDAMEFRAKIERRTKQEKQDDEG